PGPRADGPLVFAEAPRGCFIFTDCFSSPTRTEPPPSEHESGAGDHGSPTARAQTTLHCRLENALVPLMVKQRHAPGYRVAGKDVVDVGAAVAVMGDSSAAQTALEVGGPQARPLISC